MKKIEMTGALLVLMGVVMSATGSGSAGAVLGIGIALLASFYFALSFAIVNDIPLKGVLKRASYTSTNKWRILSGVGFGLAASTLLVGVLFKFQLLPGAGIMLSAGMGYMLLFVVLLVLFSLVRKSLFAKVFVVRIVVLLLLGTAMSAVHSEDLIDWRYGVYPDFAAAYKAYHKNPKSEAHWEQFQIEYEKMNQQKSME